MTRLLLVAAALVAVLAAAGVGAGAEWDVYQGGSIQDAIDGAGAGDTIYVHAGTYVENVDVYKRITLIGDGADVVTVRAADEGDHVFGVTVDWVNISGFTMTGAIGSWDSVGIFLASNVGHCNISYNNASNNDRCGIFLDYFSNNNNIAGNTANDNDYGIYLYYSNNNTLGDNNVSLNNDYGIRLSQSNNNALTNNIANDGIYGIELSFSSNNILTSNMCINNTYGILLSYGYSCNNTLTCNTMVYNHYNFGVDGGIQNIDTSNTVDGKPIYYLVGEHSIVLDSTSGAGYIGVVNSNNITIRDITLTNNRGSVLFFNTTNSSIENVTVSDNNYGILLYSSSDNTLMNNNASLNYGDGIRLSQSMNNTITHNTANNNGNGISLYFSSNNTLTDNTVNSNGYGIYIDCSSNNTLKSNTANDNYNGIELYWSSSNLLYCNNLLNNTYKNAYDNSGTNTWDSGSVGNYWSDYTGTDTNRDGIGETTYDIPGGESVDRYPLTGIRWLPPEITRSRLGINTHWNHWADDLSICKEKIRNFGIVRDQAWWAGLETSDLTGSEWDNANWDYSYSTKTLCGKEITYQSGLDNLVKLYQDEDSPELLLLLNLKNDDISSFETITADQYYDYVYHVVERYDGDGVSDMPGLIRPVRHFEVGNEVDYIRTNDSRHGYLSPADYVEKRLIPAYNAAKAANKNAIVMGSGLGMESDLTGGKTGEFNAAYLEAMYDNITANDGNKNNNFYMDKIAIHYYSQNEHPEYFDENIKEVEDVIMNKEGREKPIWVTEFAPASPPSLYARLLTLIFANRIEMPMIYNLKDEDDSEESFGLYNVTCEGTEETITPRESIQVIDTVLSTLHDTTPSETENEDTSTESGRTTYKRVFNNSDKKVTVLWYIDYADSGAVTNYEISPESPQTFTVDVLGTADFPADPSSIHLTIGSEPTYVIETDPPIDVDLYFNKTTTAGVSTERATSFGVGDTLYGKIKTTTIADHTVKTYITMTVPDGTCRYAHYDKPDFNPGSDNPLFSDTKVPLYDRDWNATTSDWLWNIYEFTGSDSGSYRWNCWYEDAETGEILGGDSTEYTFSETPSGTPVGSATGEGEVYLDSSAGAIENIAAIPPDAMPEVPESLNPVYGFFSFEITGISSGESVNIPLAFPENVPVGTEYWKHGPTPDDTTPHWYQIPVSDDDGDRIIVITLTDGGIGDDDLAVNGVIVDDGGPSLPKKGDLNRDGNITTADAAIALQLAVIGGQDPIADVSGDNRVTSLDALMILQAAAGAITL